METFLRFNFILFSQNRTEIVLLLRYSLTSIPMAEPLMHFLWRRISPFVVSDDSAVFMCKTLFANCGIQGPVFPPRVLAGVPGAKN